MNRSDHVVCNIRVKQEGPKLQGKGTPRFHVHMNHGTVVSAKE